MRSGHYRFIMTDTLEPCPFCGGLGDLTHYEDDGDRWYVRCGGTCGEQTAAEESCDEEGAVEHWNTRPIEGALRARLAEAEGRDMIDLQRRIGEWQAATFPNPGRIVMPTFRHLQSEVAELAECVETLDRGVDGVADESLADELADCFLLLCGIATLTCVDLHAAAERKLAINRKRKWGERNADGFIEHIPSPDPEATP